MFNNHTNDGFAPGNFCNGRAHEKSTRKALEKISGVQIVDKLNTSRTFSRCNMLLQQIRGKESEIVRFHQSCFLIIVNYFRRVDQLVSIVNVVKDLERCNSLQCYKTSLINHNVAGALIVRRCADSMPFPLQKKCWCSNEHACKAQRRILLNWTGNAYVDSTASRKWNWRICGSSWSHQWAIYQSTNKIK